MPLSDCGCGGLVTPSLEQLLAVAGSRPLPRIRERRAPPAKLGASLKGWLSWQLVNRQGREVAAGEGPNLILDQGLDLVATTLLKYEESGVGAGGYFPIIGYAAVGTDSTSPSTSDTGLGAEVARTNTTFSTDAISRPSAGVYELVKSIEFGYEQANGVLTEWGFSPSAAVGSNLFNRALFLDSGGSPDAVTKTEEEKLRLTYTLEVSLSPVTLTAGSFSLTGVGTVSGDYSLLGGSAPALITERNHAPDLYLFSALARGALGVVGGLAQVPLLGSARVLSVDRSGVTYTDDVVNDRDDTSSTVARDVTGMRDVYTPGSFTRTGGSWKWDTSYGNLDPIKGFGLGGNAIVGSAPPAYLGYVFDLDPGDEFSKDDEHALSIGVPTVTWGRAS